MVLETGLWLALEEALFLGPGDSTNLSGVPSVVFRATLTG